MSHILSSMLVCDYTEASESVFGANQNVGTSSRLEKVLVLCLISRLYLDGRVTSV